MPKNDKLCFHPATGYGLLHSMSAGVRWRKYTYDANGNMTTRLSPLPTIPWTSTNYPIYHCRPGGVQHVDVRSAGENL